MSAVLRTTDAEPFCCWPAHAPDAVLLRELIPSACIIIAIIRHEMSFGLRHGMKACSEQMLKLLCANAKYHLSKVMHGPGGCSSIKGQDTPTTIIIIVIVIIIILHFLLSLSYLIVSDKMRC